MARQVTTRAGSIGVSVPQPARAGRAAGSLRFDWLMAILTAWPLLGFYVDGWAHNHRAALLEDFFTPWHGVLYSGLLAVGLALGVTLARNRRQGYGWRRALPAGYGGSLVGVALFGAAGLADLVWHSILGVEIDFEALVSPPHLLLATGGILIVTGPLRAAWQRRDTGARPTWRERGPMLLSLTLALSLLTFMTMYAHPYYSIQAAASERTRPAEWGQALGFLSVILQSGLLMGMVLFALRRFTLPVGGLTLILTLNAALMSTQDKHYQFWVIPVALAAGLVADLLYRRLQPSAARPRAFRFIAFALPVTLYGLYFIALSLREPIWWTLHLTAGTVAMGGIVGLLLSYVALPPPLEAAE